MVAKALKECRVCSCHELTNNSNGYCDKHIAIGKRVRNIDKYDKFYNTKVWNRVKQLQEIISIIEKAKECTDPKIKEILISYCNERIEKLQPKG